MKDVVRSSLTGGVFRNGWLKKSLAVVILAAVAGFALPQVQAANCDECFPPGFVPPWDSPHKDIIPGGPPDSIDPQPGEEVIQLDYIKWLVKLSGDQPLFDQWSTVGDYVYWARKYKMKAKKIGWNPDDVLTQDLLAVTLTEWFKIKSKKGLEKEALAREGIFLPDQDIITWDGLVMIVDDFGFQSRLQVFSHNVCSPITRDKHKLTIKECTVPPPPVGEQKNRLFRKFKENKNVPNSKANSNAFR